MKKSTNKTSKFFIKITFFCVLALSFVPVAYAIQDYTVLAPLPGLQYNNANQTNLKQYIEGGFRLAMAIAAILAFVMITLGGIMYATTDSISNRTQGREYIENAIIGLLLVIGSYIILYTINPKMLNFTLDIKQIVLPSASTTPGGQVPSLCSNCQSLGGLPISGNSNNYVAGILLPKLNSLNSFLAAANIPWIITEAFPPTTSHRNSCHYDGTCIDARPVNRTVANINGFASAAQAAGLRPVYEVATQSEKDLLIKNGVTANVIVVPGINGAHFSVYYQ